MVDETFLSDQYIEQEFIKLDAELQTRRKNYFENRTSEVSKRHLQAAKLLVVSSGIAFQIRNVYFDNNPSKVQDPKFKLFDMMFVDSLHRCLGNYTSLNYYYYSSAFSNIRFLLETYLLFRHLNKNQVKCDMLTKKMFDEIDYLNTTTLAPNLYEFKFITDIHKFISTERLELNGKYPKFNLLFKHLSNSAVHPHLFERCFEDSTFNTDHDRHVTYFSLFFLCGIIKEYAKANNDFSDKNLKSKANLIVNSIAKMRNLVKAENEVAQALLDIVFE